MPGPLTSTTLDATLMGLVNQLVNSMVTTPGGSTLVSPTNFFGSIKTQEVDCSAVSILISAPGPQVPVGTVAQVTIGFPGSTFNITGYIKASLLSAIMNQLPVFTAGSLPAANTVPIGYVVFNSTTQRVLVSNGTSWTGTVNSVQGVNSGQLGPASSVSFSSPTIQQQGSGKIFIAGTISSVLSAQTQVELFLYRDGPSGTLLAQNNTFPGGGGPVGTFSDLTWLDTLPDGNPHYYTLVATVIGQTITVPIAGAAFQAFEL